MMSKLLHNQLRKGAIIPLPHVTWNQRTPCLSLCWKASHIQSGSSLFPSSYFRLQLAWMEKEQLEQVQHWLLSRQLHQPHVENHFSRLKSNQVPPAVQSKQPPLTETTQELTFKQKACRHVCYRSQILCPSKMIQKSSGKIFNSPNKKWHLMMAVQLMRCQSDSSPYFKIIFLSIVSRCQQKNSW